MKKYLKVTFSSQDYIIPVEDIIDVKIGSGNTEVQILTNVVGHHAAGGMQVLGFLLTATGSSDAAKNKEQINSVIDAIASALSTAWTKPMYELSPKHALTSAPSHIQQAWV